MAAAAASGLCAEWSGPIQGGGGTGGGAQGKRGGKGMQSPEREGPLYSPACVRTCGALTR